MRSKAKKLEHIDSEWIVSPYFPGEEDSCTQKPKEGILCWRYTAFTEILSLLYLQTGSTK
jgi:hypothetical protein